MLKQFEVKNIYLGEGKAIVLSDMQGPCPDGFHVPLNSEWQAICNAYTGLGLSGGDNFATYLKMPKAGSRPYYDVSPFAVGSEGFYWSSSNYNNNYNNAWALLVYSHNTYPLTDEKEKGYGCSIRGLKNTPVTPTSSRTVLYQGTGSAGIYWNSIDGLISISSDGTTWYTLMDKNLGATTVYNYGDTLTDANCGNVFQWGNNYAFPGTLSSASITTSSTQVNASTYGPGNYYSSNKFITGNNDWDSSLSANLRGGVSQGTSTIVNTGIKEVYIGTTKVYPGKKLITTAGIYHDEENGLISLSSDGSTWLTIADKNIGASVAGTGTSSIGEYITLGSGTAPEGLFVPYSTDLTNLVNTYNGISGTTIANVKDFLLMPYCGRIARNGSTYDVGESGFYGTNQRYGSSSYYSLRMSSSIFQVSYFDLGAISKTNIRLFKTVAVQPDETWSILYKPS